MCETAYAAAFDLHDDFAPFVLGLVGIQQAVHAAIRALAFAFLERTGVNERERPMLELEFVQFRQPLRAGKIRGLPFFLKLQFLVERINKVQMCGTGRKPNAAFSNLHVL
jgi:hypothetical protein